MIPKRLFKTAILLGLALNLASCGGFVADHWPHWAGGMPADVPPRPGAPGYADFIAHGQAKPEQAKPEPVKQDVVNSAGPQQPVPAASQTSFAQPPAMQRPLTSNAEIGGVTPQEDLSRDPSVVNGGLY
ncbi:MAG: hypothetical protein WBD11_04700 [Xanthobacteraceae bacterium]|jgi:hypothetical protein